MLASSALAAEELRRIHEGVVDDPRRILALLERVRANSTPLRGRRTVQGEAEEARILELTESTLLLSTVNMHDHAGTPLVLNFTLDERSYLIVVDHFDSGAEGRIRLPLPTEVYRVERRTHDRLRAGEPSDIAMTVQIKPKGGSWIGTRLIDSSTAGLCLEVPNDTRIADSEPLRVRYFAGLDPPNERWAVIRHRAQFNARSGWSRVGLEVSDVPPSSPIDVDERNSLLHSRSIDRFRSRWVALTGLARSAATAKLTQWSGLHSVLAPVEVVDFCNDRGEPIRGIVDFSGPKRGATAVVIPPAWGRTKETLLPLAATIVATFRRSHEPIVVLRYDGTRRRGESFNEPDCLEDGHEHDRFTFSDAVRDIHAAVRFLCTDERFGVSGVVLVTFSAASIEGRRALMEDRGVHLRGWVTVVGATDIQSGIRAVCGGIDFFGGAKRGARFGFQEIMGVRVQMDRLAKDALEHQLVFLEDARRDMNHIRVPVTWVHGRNDAWLDLERVRAVMSCGPHDQRRIISVPTGHQLRSSREALEVFELVAVEVGQIALGKDLPPALPDLGRLESKRRAEKIRRPKRKVELRSFWKDYLIGRDNTLGIELLNATPAYQDFMRIQVDGLELMPGHRVADLGCGTGPFELFLADERRWPEGVRVDAIDYVPAALARALRRISERGPEYASAVRFVTADLNLGEGRAIPLKPGSYDAVISSFLISYLADPHVVVREMFALLRPGGRLVLSSMRLDADVSKLFMEFLEELKTGRARELLAGESSREAEEAARLFLNDAARILDLEEEGAFRFWEADGLEALVKRAGFRVLQTTPVFGHPPQAIVVAAQRP